MIFGRLPGLIALSAITSFAQTGTVNYITDTVYLQDDLVYISDDTPTTVVAGQTLRTEIGHAELYAAPHSLVRLGMESTIEIVALDDGASSIRLTRGAIIVDVAKVKKSSPVVVLLNGTSTAITARGTYRFDAEAGGNSSVEVRRGKAVVVDGSGDHLVKKGSAAAISPQGVHVEKNDEFTADELTAWNDERSEVVADVVFLQRRDNLDLSGLPANPVVFGDRKGYQR